MAECIRKINIGTSAQRHRVIMVTLSGVLAHQYESTESYCCHLTSAWALVLASHFKVLPQSLLLFFSTITGQKHLKYDHIIAHPYIL